MTARRTGNRVRATRRSPTGITQRVYQELPRCLHERVGPKRPGRAIPKVKGHAGSEMAVGATVSGPSNPTASSTELADHAAEQQSLVEAMPFNSAKSSEYGAPSIATPPEGPHQPMPSPTAGAGTLSEKNESLKTGPATLQPQSLDGSLEGKRVNSEGHALTTNQGVPVAAITKTR